MFQSYITVIKICIKFISLLIYQRMNFLNNRVASSWNNLASTTVNAPTLNSFKARLDKHLGLANNTTT